MTFRPLALYLLLCALVSVIAALVWGLLGLVELVG